MLSGFFLTFLLVPVIVRWGRRRFWTQNIRADGPPTHLKKQGTPTLGGVAVMLSFALIALSTGGSPSLHYLLLAGLGFLLLGLLDDFKNATGSRSLGMKARYKLAGQILLALVFSYVAFELLDRREIHLPGHGWAEIPFAVAMPFYVLVFIATVNAANITDGLDGLLGGVAFCLLIFFASLALRSEEGELSAALYALAGCCIGFLWYNVHPAKVFLGNSGSMGLGGVLAAAAVLTGSPLYLLVAGFTLVIETMSVIIQVLSFRYRGTRVFRMAPLHHHFELKGHAEPAIVVRFWLVSGLAVLAAMGLFAQG